MLRMLTRQEWEQLCLRVRLLPQLSDEEAEAEWERLRAEYRDCGYKP